MVSSVLPLSTTTRSSQNPSASRHAEIFFASFLTMMIALNRGMSVFDGGRRGRPRVCLAVFGHGATDDRGGGVPRQQLDQNHLAPLRFDHLAPDDIFRAIVA